MLVPELSLQRIKSLAKLKQKKYRLSEKQVIVECRRTLEQLASWGILAQELYLGEDALPLPAYKTYSISSQALERICDSEHPAGLAGLFPLPQPREMDFSSAFYLDSIGDPGNMGTIFRIAAAFGIQCLLLSPECCEVSSPKVIRASLGAVYKVPYQICPLDKLKSTSAKLIALDMAGSTELKDFCWRDTRFIIVLGSEAHGINPEIRALADSAVRIGMPGEMESLNVAVCAGIAAYQITLT